jgi:hypothetical protein
MTFDARDLDATRTYCAKLVELLERGSERLESLAPGLPPENAWSVGSIVGQMRTNARIAPAKDVMRDVPIDFKGAAAGALQPAICLATLVGVVSPFVLVDIRRTYPKCFSALNITAQLICDHVEIEDVTSEFGEFLEAGDLLEQFLDREVSRHWSTTVVEIRSSDGAWFPSDVDWGKGRTRRTFAPLRYRGDVDLPHFWQLAVLARIKDGDFEIARARRPIPVGVQRDLRPYRMPDGVEVDLREVDLGDAWCDYRDRVGTSLSKGGGASDTYGVLLRQDLREGRKRRHVIHGPDGAPRDRTSARLLVPAPHSNLAWGGAVAAECIGVVGVAMGLFERERFVVAHVATDSLLAAASPKGGLLACPGGRDLTEGGGPAIRLAPYERVKAIAARFDGLLGHRGASAFSEEAGSLKTYTEGCVFGANKVVLTQPSSDGVVVSRSTDTGLGQLHDPFGGFKRGEDGHLRWPVDIEGELVEMARTTPVESPLFVPDGLRARTQQLALIDRYAGTLAELRHLRRALGDETVQLGARYLVAETGGTGPSPLCLGHPREAATRADLDWRLGGVAVALVVRTGDGGLRFVAGDPVAEHQIVVRTVGDHLAEWLREYDPSMEEPRRGLRRPVTVTVHSTMLQLVGRDDFGDNGQPVHAHDESCPAGDIDALRDELRQTSPSFLAPAAGVSERALRRYRNGTRSPGAAEIARLATALAEAPERRCPGCGEPVKGRADKVWCDDDACRMRTTRARARAITRSAGSDDVEPSEVDAALEALPARVDGLAIVGRAALHASPKLRPAIADAMATGMSVDELVTAVAAGGPVSSAKSPIGALVARVRGVAEHHAAERERRAAEREVRDVDLEHHLAALVSAGAISEAEAAAERRAHAQDNDTQGANR